MKKIIVLISLCSVLSVLNSVHTAGHDHQDTIGTDKPSKAFDPNKIAESEEIINPPIQGIPNDFYSKGLYGKGIKIALLDTGIDLKSDQFHVASSYNFVEENKEAQDLNGHGTKLAGVINAKRDGIGMAGIAPEAELYVAKVANDKGKTNFEWLVQGIEWAITQKVDLINISLEFPEENDSLKQAIKKADRAGILILASGGNLKFENDTSQAFPASYPEVLSVGMLNINGNIYSSEFKKKELDVFFPGEDITCTYFNKKLTLDTGVSFATAYGSGAVALMIQEKKKNHQSYDRLTIKKEINQQVQPHSQLTDLLIKLGFILVPSLLVAVVGGFYWYKKKSVIKEKPWLK